LKACNRIISKNCPVVIAALLTMLSLGVLLAEGADSAALARNLKKWQSLSPEKQRELRERLARFKALPEEERVELRRRMSKLQELPKEDIGKLRKRQRMLARMDAQAKRELRRKQQKWENLSKRLLRDLPVEKRKEINSLPRDTRTAELHRLFEKYQREKAEKFYRKLPDTAKKGLEELSDKERLGRLQKMMKEQAKRKQREELEKFYNSLPEQEKKRLDSLPEKERRRALLEMKRHKRNRPGLPPKLLNLLTKEQRKKIESLPPKKRQEAAQRILQETDRLLRPLRDKLSAILNRLPSARRREALEALKRLLKPGPLAPPVQPPPGLNDEDMKILRALPPAQIERLLQSFMRGSKKQRNEKSQ
jgi:hypothetical protein